MCCLQYLTVLLCLLVHSKSGDAMRNEHLFKIEGQIQIISAKDKTWMSDIKILVEGGRYRGYIRYLCIIDILMYS